MKPIALLIAIAAVSPNVASASGGAPTSYLKDVAPILRTACLGCHNSDMATGGFSVSSYAAVMKGGKGGKCISPGKSAESRLIRMVSAAEQPKMPPGGGLKPTDISVLKAWIDSGAKMDLPTPVVTPSGTSSGSSSPGAHAVATIIASKPIGKVIHVAAPVTAIAFSPDSTTLAVGTYRSVQFWSLTGNEAKSAGEWKGHTDTVRCLTYTKDGLSLAAGGGMPGVNGEIRIWDTKAQKELEMFGDHTDVVNGVAFSPDGKRLASGSADKSVRIWEVAGGKQTGLMRDHSDAVLGMCWSPDGRYAVSCGADWSIKVWDPIAGKRVYSVGAHDGAVNSVVFSPDGKGLLSSSADKSAKLWSFGADNSTAVRSLSGHTMYVLGAAFSGDGKVAATASADGTVILWKTADGARLATLKDARDWVYTVAFSPDGKLLAAGCWDGTVLIWTVADNKLRSHLSTLKP